MNTARGKIIKNLDCLMVGLKSLRIGGLGLDVLPEEPPNFNDKLIKAWINEKNLIIPRLLLILTLVIIQVDL